MMVKAYVGGLICNLEEKRFYRLKFIIKFKSVFWSFLKLFYLIAMLTFHFLQ